MAYFLYFLLIAVAGYFFIIFFLVRLVFPFVGFKKYQPPVDLPSEVREKIKELETSSPDARSYLSAAYEFVRANWQAERMKTVTHLALAFRTDLFRIWKERGYAHCHTINFILYTLLARSKYFSPDDIKIKHIFFNGVIHQYLQVRAGGEWIDADPSTTYLHLPLGQHSRWFG